MTRDDPSSASMKFLPPMWIFQHILQHGSPLKNHRRCVPNTRDIYTTILLVARLVPILLSKSVSCRRFRQTSDRSGNLRIHGDAGYIQSRRSSYQCIQTTAPDVIVGRDPLFSAHCLGHHLPMITIGRKQIGQRRGRVVVDSRTSRNDRLNSCSLLDVQVVSA